MATVNHTTQQGKVMFAHTLKTEQIQGKDTGKYTLMLALDEQGQNALKQDIMQTWKDFCASPQMQGRQVSNNWKTGFRTYKDVVYAKFASNAVIKTKRNEEIAINIPVFDGAGRPLKLKDEIGNGSIACVAYEIYPYYMSKDNHGVSLRLKAIQVLDLKVYSGANAESYGFATNGPAIDVDAITADAANNEFPVADEPVDDMWASFPPAEDNGDF